MYVRIARFEGSGDNGPGDNWDERIAYVREQMTSGMGAAEGPPIKRALMLVDRSGGRGAAVAFCETEDDLRQVDEFLNNMSPPAGAGTRASVELYEVAVDTDEI
ncbi:MAG: hypothetical protein ABIR67_02445 [Gaiellaceae bacterium]